MRRPGLSSRRRQCLHPYILKHPCLLPNQMISVMIISTKLTKNCPQTALLIAKLDVIDILISVMIISTQFNKEMSSNTIVSGKAAKMQKNLRKPRSRLNKKRNTVVLVLRVRCTKQLANTNTNTKTKTNTNTIKANNLPAKRLTELRGKDSSLVCNYCRNV